MIYFISDLHLLHNRPFVYKTRGFESIEEMDSFIIDNWNKTVTCDDDIYVLGDLLLGKDADGKKLLSQLNGKLHIIIGNHDSSKRVAWYKKLPNVVEVVYATRIKTKKRQYFLCHYPTLTANFNSKIAPWNIYGHVHMTELYNASLDPRGIHVGCDATGCKLISIDEIEALIEYIQKERTEAK